MKSGLFRIGILARTTEIEFKFAIEQGFDCVELSANPGSIEQFLSSVDSLRRWKKYFPIPISAVGYFGVEYHQNSLEFDNLLRLMDACNLLETCVIHVGSGSRSQNIQDIHRTIDFLGKSLDEAKKRELTLALYTCKVSNFMWEPMFWKQIYEALPDLRMKYDPSHAFHSGKRDCISEILQWGNRIVHFHAKGGYLLPDGRRDPLGDPPPGEDQIDWHRLLQALMEVEYKGDIALELHSDRYSYDEYFNVLRRSRDYLRMLNQKLLEEMKGL